MQIFGLTERGLMVSKSYRNPDTPEYRIIASIARTDSNRVTMDRICSETGLTPTMASMIIRTKLRGIVASE